MKTGVFRVSIGVIVFVHVTSRTNDENCNVPLFSNTKPLNSSTATDFSRAKGTASPAGHRVADLAPDAFCLCLMSTMRSSRTITTTCSNASQYTKCSRNSLRKIWNKSQLPSVIIVERHVVITVINHLQSVHSVSIHCKRNSSGAQHVIYSVY